MKKFINDNITWIVVIALILGAYAVYTIRKQKKEIEDTEPQDISNQINTSQSSLE